MYCQVEADGGNGHDRQVEEWTIGAGEVARWLEALATLSQDPGSVPSSHKEAHSSSKEPNAFFWPPWFLCFSDVEVTGMRYHGWLLPRTSKNIFNLI